MSAQAFGEHTEVTGVLPVTLVESGWEAAGGNGKGTEIGTRPARFFWSSVFQRPSAI